MAFLWSDLRSAVRILARSPGFIVLAIVPLALGIGVNVAIFGVVNGLLLKPLPYPEPERLVLLWESSEQVAKASVSLLNFQDWAAQSQSFEALGAYRPLSFNLTGLDVPEKARAYQVSSGVLRALRVKPLAGRLFGAEEDRPGAARLLLLSYRFWRSRFGADPDVVGRTVQLDGEPFTVAGVLPASCQFPTADVDLMIPIGSSGSAELLKNRGQRIGLFGIARLRPGVLLPRAQAEMTAIAARLAAQHPETNAGYGVEVVEMDAEERKEVRPALTVLLVAVGCVLLVACTNVAALLLARGNRRARELAIRASMGASRRRLLVQTLLESVALAAAGGLLGLLLGIVWMRLLSALLPVDTPRVEQIGLDARVLGFTLAVSLLAGLLAGLVPATRAARPDLSRALAETGERSGGGRGMLRDGLVVAELALCVVLLVGAGLTTRSLLALQSVDAGFDPAQLLTFRIALPQNKYADHQRWVSFYERLVEQARTLPNVRSASVTSLVPLTAGAPQSWVMAQGMPIPTPETAQFTLYQAVTPGYFPTLGIRLIEGRDFEPGDRQEGRQVAIIDQTLASRLWPGASPIGKLVAFEFGGTPAAPEPRWREVVGVVGAVRHHHLDAEGQVHLYVPIQQPPLWFQPRWPEMAVVARADVDPLQLVPAMRREVLQLDPDQPISQVRSMDEIVEHELAQSRLVASLLGIFSVIALVLAAVGIFGVVSYSASRRRHEFGVRIALGARQSAVLGLVLRHGLVLSGFGIAVGLLLALLLSRGTEALLYGVTATDPLVWTAVPLTLLGVALAASLQPAQQATRVDPIKTLRSE